MKINMRLRVPSSHHNCIWEFAKILFRLKLSRYQIETYTDSEVDTYFWELYPKWRPIFELSDAGK